AMGTKIGPVTTPVDWAPWLCRIAAALLTLSWRTSPSAPLPLPSWLLRTLAFTGPFRLVWTPSVTGATTGPATTPADWAAPLSTNVNELSTFVWVGSPVPALPLSAWSASTLALIGPLALVWTPAVIGATTGPDTRPADCVPRLATTVVDVFAFVCVTPPGP